MEFDQMMITNAIFQHDSWNRMVDKMNYSRVEFIKLHSLMNNGDKNGKKILYNLFSYISL